MADIAKLAAETLRSDLFFTFQNLVAMVRGECPSLLDDDSGGCGGLDIEIDERIQANLAFEENQSSTSTIDEATLDANKKTMQAISMAIDLADKNKELSKRFEAIKLGREAANLELELFYVEKKKYDELLADNDEMREFIHIGYLQLRSWENMRWHYENDEDSNPTPEELAECRQACKELNRKRLELIKQK